MELVLINWGWKRSIFPKLTLHKLTSTWRAFLLIYFYLLLHLVFSRDQNRPCFSASQPGLTGSTGYTWTSKLTVNSHFILESNSKNGRKLRDSKHWMIQYRGETNLHQVDWWSQIEGLAARESLQADAEGVYLLICSVFEMTNSWCQVSSCCISAPIPIQSPTSWSVYGSNCWLLILVNTSQCLQQKWQISEQVENPFIIFFFFNSDGAFAVAVREIPWITGQVSVRVLTVSGAPHQEFLPVPLSLLEDPTQISWPCLSDPTLKWSALKSNSSSALFRFISTLPRNPLQLCAESTGVGVEIRCFCSPQNGALKHQMFQGYIYLDL